MSAFKRIIALSAAALAVCFALSSCSAQKEDNGVADEKNMKISSAADLNGKAVAVQLRSAADNYIVENNLTNYPKRYGDMSKAVQDLIDKKVAAVVVDSNYAKKLTDGVEGVKILDAVVGTVDYRFLLNKSDAKLADKLNEQIAAFRESEDYAAMIKSELAEGGSYRVAKDSDKELKKTLTFVTEPAFEPFVYINEKDEVSGLFVAAADAIAYGCGFKSDAKTVDPLERNDAASGEESSLDPAFTTNEAQTVSGVKNSFCVVSVQAPEDSEAFITTDSFYTSELVMIIRTEKK